MKSGTDRRKYFLMLLLWPFDFTVHIFVEFLQNILKKFQSTKQKEFCDPNKWWNE
jgi:hypothetical protein